MLVVVFVCPWEDSVWCDSSELRGRLARLDLRGKGENDFEPLLLLLPLHAGRPLGDEAPQNSTCSTNFLQPLFFDVIPDHGRCLDAMFLAPGRGQYEDFGLIDWAVEA